MIDIFTLMLALLIGAAAPTASSGTATAEMGGRILGHLTDTSGGMASVHAYSDGRCAAETRFNLDGTYALSLPPGQYWIQVKVGDTEVATEPVEVPSGSIQRDFQIQPMALVTPSGARMSQTELTHTCTTRG